MLSRGPFQPQAACASVRTLRPPAGGPAAPRLVPARRGGRCRRAVPKPPARICICRFPLCSRSPRPCPPLAEGRAAARAPAVAPGTGADLGPPRPRSLFGVVAGGARAPGGARGRPPAARAGPFSLRIAWKRSRSAAINQGQRHRGGENEGIRSKYLFLQLCIKWISFGSCRGQGRKPLIVMMIIIIIKGYLLNVTQQLVVGE